jgi:hypothetical protein
MPPSDDSKRADWDWRSALALGWILLVLVVYGKMVIEERAGRVREILGAKPTSHDSRQATPWRCTGSETMSRASSGNSWR